MPQKLAGINPFNITFLQTQQVNSYIPFLPSLLTERAEGQKYITSAGACQISAVKLTEET